MLAKRIIPCLDIVDGAVVKGTSFLGLRNAGDPLELAMRYNEQSADELVFLDITASLENRGTRVEFSYSIGKTAFHSFYYRWRHFFARGYPRVSDCWSG